MPWSSVSWPPICPGLRVRSRRLTYKDPPLLCATAWRRRRNALISCILGMLRLVVSLTSSSVLPRPACLSACAGVRSLTPRSSLCISTGRSPLTQPPSPIPSCPDTQGKKGDVEDCALHCTSETVSPLRPSSLGCSFDGLCEKGSRDRFFLLPRAFQGAGDWYTVQLPTTSRSNPSRSARVQGWGWLVAYIQLTEIPTATYIPAPSYYQTYLGIYRLGSHRSKTTHHPLPARCYITCPVHLSSLSTLPSVPTLRPFLSHRPSPLCGQLEPPAFTPTPRNSQQPNLTIFSAQLYHFGFAKQGSSTYYADNRNETSPRHH
ncbi:hypothetical protein F5Y01DRAFT_224408 [Xylaria sp. FL0043]|nr:hypothetical protein F5Y01DRAFT_224408 [Xylaria sp. FL0043]